MSWQSLVVASADLAVGSAFFFFVIYMTLKEDGSLMAVLKPLFLFLALGSILIGYQQVAFGWDAENVSAQQLMFENLLAYGVYIIYFLMLASMIDLAWRAARFAFGHR